MTPGGPHVVVQPPAETTQTVPIFVPPPGAIRPVSVGRRSSPSLSSSGSSRSSTPTQQMALSDVQRIPYHHYGSPRSGRTPSSSRSSISSRTPPPGPTTVINVTAPQPATTMMPTAPTMMPPVIVMTFWYVFWNRLTFFELFKLLFSLGIDHDPPCSLCSHDLCLFLFSHVSFFTRSHGQEKSLSYYDLLLTSEFYSTDASPPSFSSTSSTTPPPLYSPSMSINDGPT